MLYRVSIYLADQLLNIAYLHNLKLICCCVLDKDISFHGEVHDGSTLYLYDSVPSTEASQQLQLPSHRNHEIRTVQYGRLLLFACKDPTTEYGDIIAVDSNYAYV